MKRFLCTLLAALALVALAGCSAASKDATSGSSSKSYAQLLHDARSAEDNEAYLIFESTPEGGFSARDGASADYEADQLTDEIKNMYLPLLNLEEGTYTELAASVSAMMVRSYGVAIVKPAEGKTDAVKDALNAYISGQQQAMQNYLDDQYQIAKAARVETAPSGEVVLVCCEDSDQVLEKILQQLKQ